MTDRPDVRLEIGSELYGGWKRISIRRALGRVAGTFDLNVTERWPGQDVSRPIQPGAACRVLVDGLAVITGYVDDVRISCSASEHSVTVRGRDKTGDLVDCCAPSMQLAGASLAVIARNLCAPFGIEVVDGAGADTVPGFKINPGDTVFETLDQLARAQGVFLTTDGEGRLVLARAGREKAGTVLELGKNVMESRGSFSMADRYSEITVLGQTAASDTWDGAKAGQQKTVVRDAGVPRYRPLILIAEQEWQGANNRAQWEINTRYGKGNVVSCTVYGWKDGERVWTPNTLVSIRDAMLGLEDEWLVGDVTFSLDDRGCRTELTLSPAEAFEIAPIRPHRHRRGRRRKSSDVWPDAETTKAGK